MPHNKLKSAIRARQAATGESYTTARAAVLAERGLPPDTITSKATERRKERQIAEEYSGHLGVGLDGTPEPLRYRVAPGLASPRPAPASPEVVVKSHGRIVDRHDFGHGERVLRVTMLPPSDDPTEEI